MYALIVFKGIYFLFERENNKPFRYEKTNQHKEIYARTGNTYTSVLVYKACHSENFIKKKNHNRL